MEVQLKELIDKIKTDGIREAEEAASKIREQAESVKNQIISKAEKDAADILSRARQESAKLEDFGKESLKHAGRNLLIQLNTTIQKIFEGVINREIKGAYSEKILQEAVLSVIKGWADRGETALEVLLSEEDSDKIEKGLASQLSSTLRAGVEIKPVPDIEAGFKIYQKDGKAYYDFTGEGIAEILKTYLNPRLSGIINKIIEEEG